MDRKVTEAEIKLKHEERKFEPDHAAEKPGVLTAELEYVIRRKDGSIREQKTQKAESFVRQFFDLLMVQMNGVPELLCEQITDVSNVVRDIALSEVNFSVIALANDDTFGTVVGTGNTAPTINDYALETQIADGVGGGQLQYGAVTFGLPTSDATASHFTITRDFSNNSGAPITVNEVGLYAYGDYPLVFYNRRTGYSLQKAFMTIRDVIGGGIQILDGETLTINYRLRAAV